MTRSLEASVLAMFFLSLSLNSGLMLLLSLIGQDFSWMKIILPIISVSLLINLATLKGLDLARLFRFECNVWRLLAYVFVFVILFYNGGLIEQTADSWWHMSLANKIGLASSFELDGGHLSGVPTRYYPPLWHANLGLANVASNISVPVFWNSFTAWGGVFKVMSFYLLTFALSGKKAISTLSVFLFILLPGMGDSYLRVSAWPSHIAYTLMFSMFYVSFFLLDNYRRRANNIPASVVSSIIANRSVVIALLLLAMLTLFTHQLELLWFYIGVLNYLIALTVYRLFIGNKYTIERRDNDLLSFASVAALVLAIGLSVYGLVSDWARFENNVDRLIVCAFFFSFFVLCLQAFVSGQRLLNRNHRRLSIVLLTVSAGVILLTVDVRHLLSLIMPSLAYPSQSSHELPLLVEGFWGGQLKLPGWHLQLRSALLYSGLISIPLSLVLLFVKPSRLTLFVAVNAVMAFLFCISPYLYQWLAGVMSYHSTWRLATLIFHPIILAVTVYWLWLKVFNEAVQSGK